MGIQCCTAYNIEPISLSRLHGRKSLSLHRFMAIWMRSCVAIVLQDVVKSPTLWENGSHDRECGVDDHQREAEDCKCGPVRVW